MAESHSLPTIETGVHEKLRPPLDWGSDDDHGIKRNRRGGESYEHVRRNGTADVDGLGDPRWVADPTHRTRYSPADGRWKLNLPSELVTAGIVLPRRIQDHDTRTHDGFSGRAIHNRPAEGLSEDRLADEEYARSAAGTACL